jgi:hypothetical protein
MLDTSNKTVRYVSTPIGRGFLNGFDPDTGKYCVQISQKDTAEKLKGSCTFRFYKAEDLEEIKK